MAEATLLMTEQEAWSREIAREAIDGLRARLRTAEAERDALRKAARPVCDFMQLWLDVKAAGMAQGMVRPEMLEPLMKDFLKAFEELKP